MYIIHIEGWRSLSPPVVEGLSEDQHADTGLASAQPRSGRVKRTPYVTTWYP